MCDHKQSSSAAVAALTSPVAIPPGKQPTQDTTNDEALGSRRKRLWDLPSHTHCPVIGVCVPMPVLRRLLTKALGNHVVASDYEFHAAAVAECSSRRPISEILQRELDRRYAVAIKQSTQAKTTPALATFWQDALKGPNIAGALWATLSHARCDEELRERVCHDIHMFQHQVGACNRADLQRLEQLQEECSVLASELNAIKERHARMLNDRNDEIENLNGKLMRLRAQLIARDSAMAALQDELQEVRAAVPALPQRVELVRKLEAQQIRIQELLQDRSHWQQRAEQEAARVQELAQRYATLTPKEDNLGPERSETPIEEAPTLRDKAVLCVGGRPASVPVYRQLIERTGGTFLHHDGGEEQSSAQLESSLAAADLVICQTGCVSHHAYWRVKDHCKRTGKQCVFVDKPSATSFMRCLHQISE